MHGRTFPGIIALLMVIPYMIYPETPLTPFPYDYKPIPTITLNPGEPLRLNLSDYIPGLPPDLVTRIIYPFQDQNNIIFQSPENPLDIAIIYPKTVRGYYICPLHFEFNDGTKSPFFILMEILSPEQEKGEKKPKPRLLPFKKQTDKTKGIDEYEFYLYDPENVEEPEIDKTKVILGNERLIFNLGIQDQSIFIPLPKEEIKDKPLRIFAQSKKGTWIEECVIMNLKETEDPSGDWRNAVSYLVSGKTTKDHPPTQDKSIKNDRLIPFHMNKDDLAILEELIEKRYFDNFSINFLLCPKQEQSQEWKNFADTASKGNMNIILESGAAPSFYPMEKADFKTDTSWNPLFTEKIHQAFGSKSIDLAELHEAIEGFYRAAVKKGAIPALSLNIPGKPRLISLISETSQEKQISISAYPLKYQYHEMAIGYLMAFSGIPIILYGDEFGLEGKGLAQLNQDLSKEQKALSKQISQILEVRKEHNALSQGVYLTLYSEKASLIFLKINFEETIMCVINISQEPFLHETRLPAPFNRIQKVKPLLKNGTGEITKNTIQIKLPPLSLEYFSLE